MCFVKPCMNCDFRTTWAIFHLFHGDLLSRRLGAITDTADGACEVNDLSKHMLFLQADIEHA